MTERHTFIVPTDQVMGPTFGTEDLSRLIDCCLTVARLMNLRKDEDGRKECRALCTLAGKLVFSGLLCYPPFKEKARIDGVDYTENEGFHIQVIIACGDILHGLVCDKQPVHIETLYQTIIEELL